MAVVYEEQLRKFWAGAGWNDIENVLEALQAKWMTSLAFLLSSSRQDLAKDFPVFHPRIELFINQLSVDEQLLKAVGTDLSKLLRLSHQDLAKDFPVFHPRIEQFISQLPVDEQLLKAIGTDSSKLLSFSHKKLEKDFPIFHEQIEQFINRLPVDEQLLKAAGTDLSRLLSFSRKKIEKDFPILHEQVELFIKELPVDDQLLKGIGKDLSKLLRLSRQDLAKDFPIFHPRIEQFINQLPVDEQLLKAAGTDLSRLLSFSRKKIEKDFPIFHEQIEQFINRLPVDEQLLKAAGTDLSRLLRLSRQDLAKLFPVFHPRIEQFINHLPVDEQLLKAVGTDLSRLLRLSREDLAKLFPVFHPRIEHFIKELPVDDQLLKGIGKDLSKLLCLSPEDLAKEFPIFHPRIELFINQLPVDEQLLKAVGTDLSRLLRLSREDLAKLFPVFHPRIEQFINRLPVDEQLLKAVGTDLSRLLRLSREDLAKLFPVFHPRIEQFIKELPVDDQLLKGIGKDLSKLLCLSREDLAKEFPIFHPRIELFINQLPVDEQFLKAINVVDSTVIEKLALYGTVGGLISGVDNVANLGQNGIDKPSSSLILDFVRRSRQSPRASTSDSKSHFKDEDIQVKLTSNVIAHLSSSRVVFQNNLFEESNQLQFIRSELFDEALSLLSHSVRTMQSFQERDMMFLIIEGLMGLGKTRLAVELIKEYAKNFDNEQQKLPPEYRSKMMYGFLPNPGFLGGNYEESDLRNSDKCIRLAYKAIVRSLLFKDYEIDNFTNDDVINKLDGVNLVLIHLDEFSRDKLVTRMLWKGCVDLALNRKLCVIPIATGLHVFDADKVPRGSRFTVERRLLTIIDQPLEISRVFYEKFGIQKNCDNLDNLINDCGGHAASLNYLKAEICSLPADKMALLRTGVLDVADAESIFRNVSRLTGYNYSQARWIQVLAPESVPSTQERLSDRSREILKALLIVVAAQVPVDAGQAFGNRERRDNGKVVSFRFSTMQEAGLVTLTPVTVGQERKFLVNMPFLAISVMNEYVKAIPLDVLSNSFQVGPSIIERIAVVSLHLKLLAYAYLRGEGKEVKLSELRPGAKRKPSDKDPVMVLPTKSSIKLEYLGTFAEKGGLQLGRQGDSGIAPNSSGIMLLAAEKQAAYDGFGLVDKKEGGRAAFLLQSKSLDIYYHRDEGKSPTSRVTPAPLKSWLDPMKRLKGTVLLNWLGPVAESDTIVYDVFTDLEGGQRGFFDKLDFDLGPNEIVQVTTRQALSETVGYVLAVRSRLYQPRKRMRTSSA